MRCDSVKCWGWNVAGELGYGDTNGRGDQAGEMGDVLSAVDFGTGLKAARLSLQAFSGSVILSDGSVKMWGINSAGNLGLGDAKSRGNLPGQMGGALPALVLVGP